jgi:WD40 repeat protein
MLRRVASRENYESSAYANSKLGLFACSLLLLMIGQLRGLAQSTAGGKPELVLQTAHTDIIRAVAFSPDGRWLATGSGDNTVKIWDVASGFELRNLTAFSSEVKALAFSSDSQWVATAGVFEKDVNVWEVATGRQIGTLTGHNAAILAMAFSPDGRWLATGSMDHTVKLWDLEKRNNVNTFSGFNDGIFAVAFSRDSRWLGAAGGDKAVTLWEVPEGKVSRTLSVTGHADIVHALALGVDGHWVAAGNYYNSVKLWEKTKAPALRALSLTGHTNYVRGVALSADGRQLASGAQDNTVKVWDVSTGRLSHTLKGHRQLVDALAFSPDGRQLATTSWDNTVKLWDTATWREVRTFGGQTHRVNAVAFSPDGHWLASASNDSTLRLWDFVNGRELLRLDGHSPWFNAVTFSADGRWLAATNAHMLNLGHEYGQNTARIWEVGTWREVCALTAQEIISTGLDFSRDGRWLVTGGGYKDKTARIWDVATCRPIHTLIGHTHRIDAASFSPDGRLVATGSLDRTIRLWETAKGQQVLSLTVPKSNLEGAVPTGVQVLCFSPDGKRLATGSWGQSEPKIWDVATGKELLTLKGHFSGIHSLAFTHNGEWLLSGSSDHTVRVWDAATGAPLRTLNLPADIESAQIAVTSDERWMASANNDGSTRIWDFSEGHERVALISLGGGPDWIALTPDGLFDGTADSMQQVAWRAGNTIDVTPLDSFFNDFFYPGLRSDILTDHPPAATVDLASALQIPGLRTMLAEKQVHLEVRDDHAVVCFEQVPGVAVQSPADVGSDRPMEMNGYRVVPADPTCKYQRELPGEGNPTELVTQWQNSKPAEFTTPWDGKPSETIKSTLHLLTVGVGQYPADSGFETLPYTVSSARAVEDFFTGQENSGQKPYAVVKVWPGLYDGAATRGAIRKELTDMAASMSEDDVVLLYLAGHGVVVPGQEMFYFVPADANGSDIRSTGLNTAMLAEALRNMPARRIVLIIDACQSGGAVEALSKIGEVKARVEQQRAQRETKELPHHEHSVGVHIIAATLPLSYAAGLKASKSALASTLLKVLRGPGQVSVASAIESLKKQLPAESFKATHFSQVPLTSSIGSDFAIAAQ